MEALEWPGQKDYNKAKIVDFKLSTDKSSVGTFKTSGNFTFVRIFEAGHMVPFNQPAASLDMLNRWLAGEWLAV